MVKSTFFGVHSKSFDNVYSDVTTTVTIKIQNSSITRKFAGAPVMSGNH